MTRAVDHPRPITEGLFTWPADEPTLLGSRCAACGAVTFPVQRACPRCTAEDMQREELPRRGTLWTWTVQGYPPKPPYAGSRSPGDFEPYGVGYVALADELLVEARLTVDDPAALRIGMEMELVVAPFARDDAGRELVTYAFRPAP